MKELNSAQMGQTAGSICRLPRPVFFPKGRGCSRLRAEATITLKNTNGGAQNLTGATLKWALAVGFDTATLRFGDRKMEVVDTSLPYLRAREMFVGMTCDDFLVQAAAYNSGVAKRVKDVLDADVIATAVASGATAVVTVEYTRAFELNRLGQDAYAYCPGSTQMGQVQWEFVRGGTADPSGNFIWNQAADVLFIADDFEASDDRWASVPRIYQQEEAGRESHGPRTAVGLLAVWEYTGAGAATPLTLFSIARDEDVPVHDNVNAKRVVRDALYTDPVGAFDLNVLATVLHNLPGDGERHDIPTGSGFRLVQTGTELNPMRSAWLHVPVRDQGDVDKFIGENVQTPHGVKLINAAAKSGRTLASTAAALEPVVIAQHGDKDFEALPGRLVSDGGAAVDHVPDSVVAAGKAQVANAPGAVAKDAASDKVSSAIAKAIPGALPGRRNTRGAWRQNMAAHFKG